MGTLSVTSASSSAAPLDVYASSASFTGSLLTGRLGTVPASLGTANLLTLTEGSNVLFQVESNGFVTCQNGLQVNAGGVSAVGAQVLNNGGAAVIGNVVTGGAVSITSSTASGAVLDVLASSSSFAGNAIQGQYASTGFGAAINLLVGTSFKFSVRDSVCERVCLWRGGR